MTGSFDSATASPRDAPRLWAILLAGALLLLTWSRPAAANQCYAATGQGTAPAGYQSYCWLDFTGYSDAAAQTAAGQTFSFTLADGSSLTLALHVSTTGASPALTSVAVPSWSGAAFGNVAFLGISGKPVLYQAKSGSKVNVTLSHIALTPPAGTAPGSYGLVAADGESTNGGESLSFTTNGAAWTELAAIPQGSAYPSLSGVGTATVTETGVNGRVGSYAFETLNNPTQISSVLVGSGLQGAIFGINYGSVSVNTKLSTMRANASDQFTYGVSTAGGTVIATATSTGTGAGPFAAANVATMSGNYSFIVQEAMAAGSVSPMSYYVPSLTCTNAASSSSTVMPSGVNATSYTFSGLQFQDAVTCTFSNALSPLYVPDHFAVSTPGTAVNCQPATVTIAAHTSTHATLAITSAIYLSTSTGHGDWSLMTGSGAFSAGGSNTGTATYSYALSDQGVAVFALRDTYPEAVTINVTDGTTTATSGTALASEDRPLSFVPSGFQVTNGNNVATLIGTQRSGVTSTQSLALQAIRTDARTGACTAVFASGTTVKVGLAFQCNNPTSCVAGQTLSVTSNGISTSVAANPNSGVSAYTSVPLKFSTANGEAPFALTYTDAGQITLDSQYNIPLGNGAASANNMLGAAQFVVQPYALAISNVKSTGSGAANPAAGSASGAAFIGAGQSFTATVTASNYQGNATPNFGQETSTPSVALTSALVLPAAGHNPAVSGAFGTYSGGSATGTAFGWPEVGIITLTPSVANYLGSGAILGTTSGNIGRFIPNDFSTSLNTPIFGTACSAGSFTYVGEPFTYTVAPVITATAQALGGTTTQNYTGALMRLSNSSLAGRTYSPTPLSPALALAGLPPTSKDPAIQDLGNGSVTLTFNAGSGLAFARGTPVAPFSASIALSENVIDQDGAAASNPVTFNGTGSGILWSTSSTQYYGRLALLDAVGSELLDLPMRLTAQYYLNATQGFATNTSDSCTGAPAIAFSNYQQSLIPGKTCVRDSGSPGASGIGCAAAASPRYNAVASGGNFDLILAAPGSGSSGAVTVTAIAPSWLQYLWAGSSGVNSNPSGVAAFGVFPGPASRVHQREVY